MLTSVVELLCIHFANAWCAQLTELKEEVQPLLEMVKDGRIPQGKASCVYDYKPVQFSHKMRGWVVRLEQVENKSLFFTVVIDALTDWGKCLNFKDKTRSNLTTRWHWCTMHVWAVAAWPQLSLHAQLRKELCCLSITLMEVCLSESSPLCLKGADYLKTKQQLYLKWVVMALSSNPLSQFFAGGV